MSKDADLESLSPVDRLTHQLQERSVETQERHAAGMIEEAAKQTQEMQAQTKLAANRDAFLRPMIEREIAAFEDSANSLREISNTLRVIMGRLK